MKQYGTPKEGIIFSIEEDKLTLYHIQQMRNYLNSMEKKLKQSGKTLT